MTNRKRHTAQEIIAKLELANELLAEGRDLSHVYQELQISRATYHRWRSRVVALKAEEARLLQALEDENANLKKRLAAIELENAALKEIARGKF